MADSKLYLDGERAGESLGIFEMLFQGCVQKCKFCMESTTTVLIRNANLVVKGLSDWVCLGLVGCLLAGTALLPLSHDVSTVTCLLLGFQMSMYSESYGY